PIPAYLRDTNGAIAFTNPAYRTLVAEAGLAAASGAAPTFVHPGATGTVAMGAAGAFEIVEFETTEGRGGFLVEKPEPVLPELEGGAEHLAGLIDALATPVAIFDAARQLVQFNQAYADLWGLDPRWLQPGLNEREILDRLRTE